MEQLQGTSPQHFEPTSQDCHILTLNSKGVPLGNSQKMTIPDYQLNISAGCSLSLLQVPLVHMNPFCSTFHVPLLPLRFLKVSKGGKGTSQIHVNEHKLPQGIWNSCKAHPLNILSQPTRVAIYWPWTARWPSLFQNPIYCKLYRASCILHESAMLVKSSPLCVQN